MKAAAELVQDARDAGNHKQAERIMRLAIARADRESAEESAKRRRNT
jgi:hypothetical protein